VLGERLQVILDISRLLASAQRASPTGIDRVELAYARRWVSEPGLPCTFVAEVPLLGHVALPRPVVTDLVFAIEEAWSNGGRGAANAARRVRLAAPFGRSALTEVLRRPTPKAFVLVSHRALERPNRIEALRRQGCRFVPLIHDLIPLLHPEFAREGHADRHRKRIATTARLADAIVVNSAATATDLVPWLSGRAVEPAIAVAPLGVTPPAVEEPPVALRPYFVALGTIEPRKNHLLLLNLWRQLAATLGPAAPRLIVVGRRGWENENVVDMLERCAAIDGIVRETGPLPDREVASLLRGARALLFPSFAEGFGLPLAEALALGVPCIASDLPALREVGGAVPDYLDPLDGVAWRSAVLDYARGDSVARRAQMGRMAAWKPPSWSEHFGIVDGLLEALLRERPPARLAPPLPARAVPAERQAAAPVRDETAP
jgi:glycosyltransferase involved in cell wall biosynthesis